ncbi:tetratricopeptide repeat protein [Alienimonas californiensis]|uniref:Tetratricopeptide repeat protein n=1 Tax=Alienimonas californiensis TaxID=2527989 RepID=A0A517P674_9PLAN|nr:tetratricopeptide repeat protein [Alienimonas californiensis]QDT14867.1 Tetratricopeptide repeat protein [Alienimonas californiensis]
MFVRTTVAVLGSAALAAALSGCHQLAGHAANMRGKQLYAQGQTAAAAEEFRRAALDDPAEADYRHNLAAATQTLRGPGPAEALYKQTLALDPDHQPTVHKLAELYLNTGRPQAARALTAQWAAARPGDPRPHVEVAYVLRRTGDPLGAERELRTALAADPNHAIALANLAELQARTGRTREAAQTAAAAKQKDWTVKTPADVRR